MFSGARPGVQKVCIVLTNEQRPSKRYSDDVKTAVEPLHQAGVRVIAIGVTSLADWRQLRVLTRDPKDVIRSRSCDSLVAKVSHLFRRTCYKAGKHLIRNRLHRILTDCRKVIFTTNAMVNICLVKSSANEKDILFFVNISEGLS